MKNTLAFFLFVLSSITGWSHVEKEVVELNQFWISTNNVYRYSEKWGALTVALWFVKESAGDDKNLIKWINYGPNGILTLALKHLPVELKDSLKSSLEL